VINAEVRPLFGDLPQRLRRRAEATAKIPNLSLFYTVHAPVERFEQIAARLRRLRMVEGVYIKPPVDLPAPVPAVTPDFSGQQGYLNSAPGGIDARWAWTVLGGDGTGSWIIDVERAWRFSHEDLLQNQGGVIGGFPPNVLRFRDHGTAVVGILVGDRNGRGILGICPKANMRAISTFDQTGQEHTATAIATGALALRPGDVLVLEMHRPGPKYGFTERPDRKGYIPVEWFPDDFAAIRHAIVSLGVIVVEAAGNGWENLDDGLYDSPGPGFPSWWQNPFRRGSGDSGAILVGAGAPPVGGHGTDRSRLNFSNYGQAVDAQGWGLEVVTTGYGHLQDGPNEDRWYTDTFGGTSGATPMVAGAIACLQGILRASGRPLRTPSQARSLVRTVGSPQQHAVGAPVSQRIGPRPSLKQMVGKLLRRRR
jgi:subtilisin family serine protease